MNDAERDTLFALIRQIGDLRVVVEALLREFPAGHPSHDRARLVVDGIREDERRLRQDLIHLIADVADPEVLI